MIRIVKDQSEIEDILKVLSSIACPNELPAKFIKKENWKISIFEALDLFEEEYFNFLKTFFQRTGSSNFYLTNANFNELYKILKFDALIRYREFFDMVHDELDFANAYNILFFDDSNKWLIYIDTLKDIIFYAYDPDFKSSAVEYFLKSSYRVKDINSLKEYLEEMQSVRNVDSFIEDVFKNYNYIHIEK